MINLLPSDLKQSLVFAHHNTKLVKLIVGLGAGIVGIILIIAVGYVYLQQEVNSAKTSIKDTETSLKQQNETETLTRAQEISSSLNLVVDVLSQEILFSKLLRQVGAVMPPNTVLQDLSLSSELNGSIDLQVGATNYDSATQVQVNLEQRPDSIFERADLNNVNCRPADAEGNGMYPCTASVTAIFSKENNFTLLGGAH